MKKFVVLFLVLLLLLTACATVTPAVTETTPQTLGPAMTEDSVLLDETETPSPVSDVSGTSTALTVGGGGIFTDFVRSNDSFSLRCSPGEIIFGVRSLDETVTQVMFFYRVIDKSSSAAAGAMVHNKAMVAGDNGHFTLLFKATELDENLRYANGWFEYQVVGLNKGNAIVGRSEKVVKQVTFTIACP